MNNNEPIEESYFQLQDFVADSKRPFPTILLVGKRMAGKSNTSVAIAEMYNVGRWAAWCGTKDTEDFWADRFGSHGSVFAPDDRGVGKLLELLEYQQRKIRLYKRIIKKPLPDRYSIGLVFDDVTAKRKFRKGEILEDLFSNGRHYHAVIIISCQYIKQLPPAVRTNADYIFMLHNSKRTCKILHDEYVTVPEDYSMFLELLRIVTSEKYENGKDKYSSLVFNNCTKSENLEDLYQIYTSKPDFDPEHVHLGSAEWREFNAKTYVDKDLENDEKEYRKHKREVRLEQYKLQRQTKLNTTGVMDADYFSDSDPEYDSEEDTNGSKKSMHRIQNKKGSVAFNIQFGDPKLPQNSIVPQLANSFQTPFQPNSSFAPQNHFQPNTFQNNHLPQTFNRFQTNTSFVPQTPYQPNTFQNNHVPQTFNRFQTNTPNNFVPQTPYQPNTFQNNHVPQTFNRFQTNTPNHFVPQTPFHPNNSHNNSTSQTPYQPNTSQNNYVPRTSSQSKPSPNNYAPQNPFQGNTSQNNYAPQNGLQPHTPSNFVPQNGFQSNTSQNNFVPQTFNRFQPSTPNNFPQTAFQPNTFQNNYVPQTFNRFQPNTPTNFVPQTGFQPNTSQNKFVPQTPNPYQPLNTQRFDNNSASQYPSQYNYTQPSNGCIPKNRFQFNNFSRPSVVF
jgi:hypothetical protein